MIHQLWKHDRRDSCILLDFLQTSRVGFLKIAARQYVDDRAAIRGSSVWQCADHLCGNARTLRGSLQCGRSLWMNTQVYALDQRRVLAAEVVSLQSCYRWAALSIGQPFCHSQTTVYVASLWLSWMFVINKRSIYYKLAQYFFNWCMCICCMQSYIASSCTYVGVDVQVNFSHFRSFEAAYEESV